MELNIKVEEPSKIVRKLTITVEAGSVKERFNASLSQAQKTAKIKGFRAGKVPLNVVEQYYGDDIRHKLFHGLIEESFREAITKENLRPVGQPQIQTNGKGHKVDENEGLTYTATVEIMPEIKAKTYTGFSLKRPVAEVTDEDVEKVLKGIQDSHAQLIPVKNEGGLILPGKDAPSSREVRKGDYVDFEFKGGVVTDSGIEERDGMSGARVLEVGAGSLIPGFEENMEGMRAGETKTFRVPFPKDYPEKELAGKEAEFTISIKELKEKKVPELNDDFAKELNYGNLTEMRERARTNLEEHRRQESDRAVRSDLLKTLIDKNKFDVPQGLVMAQAQELVKEFVENLKQQRFSEELIQQAVQQETENFKKRAESQVRAGLLLDAVADQEGIKTSKEEVDAEIEKMAKAMQADVAEVKKYYLQNPNYIENLTFKLREEKTVAFLLEKSKIKDVKGKPEQA